MSKDPRRPDPEKKRSPAGGAAPSSKVKVKATPECPRCNVSLSRTKYEGVNVDFCDACWGYWVGLYQFETILSSKDEVFSKEERRGALSDKAKVHSADGTPLSCARCEHHMQKLQVKDEWGAPAFFLDYCKDHGLWLDTGEIKRSQILDERTGNVRKALRASVGKGKRPVDHADED